MIHLIQYVYNKMLNIYTDKIALICFIILNYNGVEILSHNKQTGSHCDRIIYYKYADEIVAVWDETNNKGWVNK